MTDLQINKNGDLSLEKIKELDLANNTLLIQDLLVEKYDISYLIERAIKTPKGYIEQPILSKNSIDMIDTNFGSLIYEELSEGITLNFISRVKTHITNSLKSAGLISHIANVNLSLTEDLNTIQLTISYLNQASNTIINLNI